MCLRGTPVTGTERLSLNRPEPSIDVCLFIRSDLKTIQPVVETVNINHIGASQHHGC